ncbi:MAG: helix-turn-helix transcriptional regulator [Spirochaetes bacterium]|nr:helix-turn-helix transcriptional regulator [Spirochaetota bacterium]
MPLETKSRHYSGPPSPLGCVRQAARQWSRGLRQDRVFGSWALVLVLHGSGRYRDALGRSAELRPGDVILVFPDLAHHYGPASGAAPWEEIYLVFEGPLFELWRNRGLLRESNPIASAEDFPAWKKRFEAFLSPPPSGAQGALREVLDIQQMLADLFHADRSHLEKDSLSKAMAQIDRDPVPEIDWPVFAARFGLGYESFRKQFRQRAGVSPGRYRLQRLIERACALLQAGRPSHRALAEELGFADEFHFSRSFKKIAGMSPKNYRALLPRRVG